MNVGAPGTNGVRITDLKDCQEVIDVFYKHGFREIDSAGIYCNGTTEEVKDRSPLRQ